jgi:hypothetical protein
MNFLGFAASAAAFPNDLIFDASATFTAPRKAEANRIWVPFSS